MLQHPPPSSNKKVVDLPPAPIEHLQPLRPIRPLAKRRWAPLLGWYVWGVIGGILLLLTALVIADAAFPPARYNVLILGIDRRPGETGPSRTDTMMLATVNPSGPYIGLLSIPRDLWVRFPNGSENRINTAHFFAEAQEPGSGPMVAVQTVSSNFGITLNRHIRLDLAGFVRIVDSVGGITVDVERPLFDYEYPTDDDGTQVVSFEPGVQHMTGEQALQYARIRHGSSDFQRAKRQQVIMAAFLQRLLQPDAWPRLPLLYLAIVTSVDTNVTPLEALRLLPAVIRVGPAGIDRRVIEGSLVQPYTTANGAAVQLPVWQNINPVLFEMFDE